MNPDLKSVLEAILDTDGAEQPTCRRCQDVLYVYIGTELDGEDPAAIFPAARLHLGECDACQQEYEELKALLLMERRGEFAQPPVEPAFDFSFLEAAPRRPSIWETVESAGQEITRLFTEVRVLISRERASFAQLPGSLSPAWAAAPALREKAARPETQTLPLPAPEHDISLSLTVGPVSGDETAFSVQVTQISSGQPLSRARVTVRDEQRRLLISELTHADGRVTFPHIGSGSYLVEVKHQSKVWELPMTFTLADS